MRPGDVIVTPAGPVAVTGCDRWPSSDVPYGGLVSGLDERGRCRFFRRAAREWVEVWHG